LVFGDTFGQTNEPYGNLIFHDTLKFTPLHSWININNPEENIWEVGKPSKDFFSSAHQGERVILTDSIDYYSINCNDFFYITIPWTENYWGEGILSFYHKFDTDTLKDGGVIEISYDDGTTWLNILDDDNHISINFIGLYEGTIWNGNYGFSGKSNGWQYVELYWYWCAVTKSISEELDYPIIRFSFISDDTDNPREGWMIDDIVFRGYDIGGTIENNESEKTVIFPNPSNDYIIINLNNLNAVDLFIEFYNPTGTLVMQKRITSNSLSIKDLKKGVYIYRIIENHKIINRGKLIKN
jgi:hypothetical protein